MIGDANRRQAKRDRLARFYRALTILNRHQVSGVRVEELARRLGVSRRTAYRDLRALEEEIGIAVWNQGGRWGVPADAFLPPLHLTVDEAMAIVLAARLMVRYADKYHPELASAFEKLEAGLPPALREHVDRTLDVLARRRVDVTFSRHVRLLTRAWAERRTVSFLYAPARYGPEREPRQARVRPYLLEPSGLTHALYLIGFDETRGAVRTFKVERIKALTLTGDTFDRPEETAIEEVLGRAWDIIADQPLVDVVLRFSPEVAARVTEATWHPSQRVDPQPDGSLLWRATVSGTLEIRLWILSWGPDVEVLEPPSLREEIAATLHRTLARYGAASG